MMASASHSKSRLVAALLLAALGGCANYSGLGSDNRPLAVAALSSSHSLSPEDGQWPSQAWWKHFNDPQLDDLIDEALSNSPTLAQAAAHVASASASLEGSQAATRPSLGLSVDATRQHYTENGMYPAPLGGSTNNSGNITLQGSYEVDFWGRNRAAVAASRSRQAAAEAEAASARLLLASAVAKTYFQLAESQSFRRIGERALEQRQQIYALTRQRVSAGLDTQVELKQAETQLPLTRTNIAQVEENIVNTQHALAALLGAGPDRALKLQAPLPVEPLPAATPETAATPSAGSTPATPFRFTAPANLPLDLLGHRPDLVAARWQVEATRHDTDAAKSAFYPNINLVAFAGYSSIGLDRLVRSSSENYGGGPALSLPVFDGGRLRSGLKFRYAAYDAAVANYNRTLVEALRDVADQLNSYRALQPQIEQQQLALDAASTAYELAMQRYHAGLGNYLTVLNAQSMVLEQQLFRSQLLMRARTVQVELSRALGGGYPAIGEPPQWSSAPAAEASQSSTPTALSAVLPTTSSTPGTAASSTPGTPATPAPARQVHPAGIQL